MSYSNPIYDTVSLGSLTMATQASSISFKGPKGLQGELLDVRVTFTSNLTNGTTTGPVIKVGNGDDDDAYLAAWTVVAASTNVTAPEPYVASATTGKVTGTLIAADTEVLVAFTAPTGGSPANGAAMVSVLVRWF